MATDVVSRRGILPRRQSLRSCALLLAAVLVVSACGTRLDREVLLADARSSGAGDPEQAGGAQTFDGAESGTAVVSGDSDQSPVGGDQDTGVGEVDGGGVPSTGVGGGSPGDAGSSGSAPAATQVQSCTESLTPIRIGTVGETSGIIGSILANGIKTMQAWVASVNERGGIACHPLEYIVADSGADPARQQAQVRRLVEEEGVIAFVYMVSPIAGSASVDYITSKRIPAIGNENAEEWFYSSPMYFPQTSSGDQMLRSIFAAGGYVAEQTGTKKLAATSCLEVPLCSTFFEMAPTESPNFGMDLVYNAQVSIATPDYTSNCRAAQQAGGEIFLAGLDPNSVLRMARSCSSVNYKPHYLVGAPIAKASLLDDPRLEGTTAGITNAPFFDRSIPEVAAYQDVMARYAPGEPLDVNGMTAWAAARLFEVAAKDISEPPTSESILEGLWSIKDNDLGGITHPLTFVREQPSKPVFCYWLITIRSGEYVSPNGSKRTCP